MKTIKDSGYCGIACFGKIYVPPIYTDTDIYVMGDYVNMQSFDTKKTKKLLIELNHEKVIAQIKNLGYKDYLHLDLSKK